MNPGARRGTLVLVAAVGTLVIAAISSRPRQAEQSVGAATSCRAPAEVEARIEFYSGQIESSPRRYPTLALLGKAYLDRVRWTGNPYDLAAARDCLQRSIDVQPNLAAYKVFAAVNNYSHRFDEALRWCDLAAGAAPADLEILAMRTEALLALDRPNEVAAMLNELEALETIFHAVGCRGMLAAAQDDRESALADFQQAARLARELGSKELIVWAQIASAALFLDHGVPAEAEPYLCAADEIDPDDYDLQVHWAEFDEGTGRDSEALARYEHVLRSRCDAEVHRRAYLLAGRLGQPEKAAQHFAAAEQLWRSALDLGEVYPLEGLSKLYCDAGKKLDEALRLAERNFQFKRDPSARDTLERARSRPDGR